MFLLWSAYRYTQEYVILSGHLPVYEYRKGNTRKQGTVNKKLN